MELNKIESQITQEASIGNCKVTRNEGAEHRLRKATRIQGSCSVSLFLEPPDLSVCHLHRKLHSPTDWLPPCCASAGPTLQSSLSVYALRASKKQRVAIICALIPHHRCIGQMRTSSSWSRGGQTSTDRLE